MNVALPKPAGALAVLIALASPSIFASPLLRCDVTYAGSTQTVDTRTVSDPYPVASVDISGRFRFKAVMVGQGTLIDYIKLYTYLQTARHPVLVQQATYRPPFMTTSGPDGLTGEQRVYGGPKERELLYRCTLQEVSP